jgi:hypothetical protein
MQRRPAIAARFFQSLPGRVVGAAVPLRQRLRAMVMEDVMAHTLKYISQSLYYFELSMIWNIYHI